MYSSSASSARHWTVVIRCKDQAKAKKMAQTMKNACDNQHVGYDKVNAEQRNSFFYALKAANWDASKITKDVECSCTPLIAACINAAGIEITTDRSATSLYNLLKKDSRFTCFTTSDYYASDKKLVAGDILLSTGSHQHGAMVVSSPNSVSSNAAEVATASDSAGAFKKGINYITTSDLCIRYGPGTDYEVKKRSELTEDGQKHALDQSDAVLKEDTIVTCLLSSGNWIKIPSGWICGKDGDESYVRLCTKEDEARIEAQEAAQLQTEEAVLGETVTEDAEAKKAAEEKAAAEAAAKKAAEEKAAAAKKAAEEKAAAEAAAKKAADEKAAAAKKAAEEKAAAEAAAKKAAQAAAAAKKPTSAVIGGMTIKVGNDYTLAQVMNVRRGPSTKYAKVLRSKLSRSAKKCSKKGKYAVFKKNTVVTCLEIKGEWIRVPSGWICAKAGNLKGQKVIAAKKAAATTVTVKKNKVYKLSKDLFVRTGPGTNYSAKNYSQLSADAKKHAFNQTQAKLRKGTEVTCLEVRGDWMRIPSGWVCCKPGNVTAA